MPIKLPSAQNIPYVTNYRPYSVNTDTQLCELIGDMVSVDLQANPFPVEIDYFLGASQNADVIMNVKNLTNNVNILIELTYDSRYMTATQPNSFNLNPAEQREIKISLNKDVLNRTPEITLDLPVTIKAKNVSTGQLAVKQINSAKLSPKYLPQKITVI